MKKISLVSSSRADYGILKNLIFKMQKDKKIDLSFYVTGSHLQNKFGKTVNEIIKDKIIIKKKIRIDVKGDKNWDIANAVSTGIRKFSQEFKKNKPDILLVLGDRYEIFSVAVAAMTHQIPIAHIHGGESTEGIIDEAIRHSITKMSHIHFVSTKKYFKRLIQLGEKKQNIFYVGSLGVENLRFFNYQPLNKIKKKYKIFEKKILMITFHPETLENNSKKNLLVLLSALKKFKNSALLFTMANAEAGYKEINNEIRSFCKKNKNAHYFKSMGQDLYFSLCKKADCIIGNSSSGIIEAPSLITPTINLGNRQLGRVKAKSVISIDFNKKKIIKTIQNSLNFKNLKNSKKSEIFKNPYKKNNTSDNILKKLKSFKTKNILIKKFNDLNFKTK
jgi:GDP/UDP-N,N'-diacetylbacillosamine 2-epimerase (hydrolysing)